MPPSGPIDPQTQLWQVQADLITLQLTVAELVHSLPTDTRLRIETSLAASANEADRINGLLPVPGAVEEITHQINLASRKLLKIIRETAPKG